MRVKYILSKFTIKNLNAGIAKFQKAMDTLDRGLKKWDKIKKKSLIGMSKQEYNEWFHMPKKDYGDLLGKSDKKDYSFLTGKK